MHEPIQQDFELRPTDVSVLVAILIAARRTRDELLERVTRRELETQHGIRVSFREEATRA